MGFSFVSVAVVAAIAVGAPLLLGLARIRLPAVVLEIGLGVVVGPHALGVASLDEPVRVLALVGLAFLLLLAGLELELAELRGRLLGRTGAAWAVSFALAVGVGIVLQAAGVVSSALLVAIMLSATGLGVILPILKDAGATATRFGQVIVAGSSIAEVGPIVLLSLFFSSRSGSVGAKIVLLVGFLLFAGAVVLVVLGLQRSMRLSSTLVALQDTTAEIRVRAAFLLLAVFAALASRLGLEAILGAFLAGAALRLVDDDRQMSHPLFRAKLEAAGFGVFIPAFFVTTGMGLDVGKLLASPGALARVPLFVVALLVVRGLPALLYRPFAERAGQLVAGGLFQATSLGLLVVGGQIGVEVGALRPLTYTAIVSAGLVSVLVFPTVAGPLLGGGIVAERPREPDHAVATATY